MDYAILVLPAARRDLKNLDPGVLAIADAAICALAKEPRPFGCKKLRDEGGAYRIRLNTQQGPYRVIYAIRDQERQVVIARVVPRRDAY